MITYSDGYFSGNTPTLRVYVDGKIVGYIQQDSRGWKYYPKGNRKMGSPHFALIAQLKKHLEAE